MLGVLSTEITFLWFLKVQWQANVLLFPFLLFSTCVLQTSEVRNFMRASACECVRVRASACV